MIQYLKVLFAVAMAVCVFSSQALGEEEKVNVPFIKPIEQTLRFAHVLPTGSLYDQEANRFAELVNQYTRGEIEIYD